MRLICVEQRIRSEDIVGNMALHLFFIMQKNRTNHNLTCIWCNKNNVFSVSHIVPSYKFISKAIEKNVSQKTETFMKCSYG